MKIGMLSILKGKFSEEIKSSDELLFQVLW